MAAQDDHTSVRVALRIRPQLPREVIQGCRVCTYVSDTDPQVTLGKGDTFTYDHVFDLHASQDMIFTDCVRPLVDGCFEGYNATILAYGQTGSGKTYTMGTGFDLSTTQDQLGVIPRAVQHLFNGIEERKQAAAADNLPPPIFVVSAQFMELYNEEINDLLNNARNRGVKSNIRIHEDSDGNVFPVGVITREVHSAEETLKCLEDGALNRTTASTRMNSESSRSHAIFTIHIKQTRTVKNNNKENIPIPEGETTVAAQSSDDIECEILSAKFHFTDLAGSERIKRTGATGQRAKEGISINCGLFALGKVISALGDPEKQGDHVPYRDSKLTRLLEDSLGGNSRTLMIACISPSDADFMETKSTLRYAYCVRNIKNKVEANQDKASKQLQMYKQQIANLQLELTEYKMGKRVAGSDSFNDMYQENKLLQEEANHLRMRVRAMQETIDSQTTRITKLIAEKLNRSSISQENGDTGEEQENNISNIVEDYIKEIEQLRAQVMETEAICENLRKKSNSNIPSSPFTGRVTRLNQTPIPMSGAAYFEVMDNSNADEEILNEAKKDLSELLNRKEVMTEHSRSQSKLNGTESAEPSDEVEEVFDESVEEDSDEEDVELILSEEEAEENEEMQQEIAEITCEIDIKQRLIMQLETQQAKFTSMRTQYESKLKQLTTKIKLTEEERDKVLYNIGKKGGNAKKNSEESQKIKQQYEKKINSMQKEMSQLQQAKKKHAILLRQHSRSEQELKKMKTDLDVMKKTRVRLMGQMKEEQKKNKTKDTQRLREINVLKKDQRKRDHKIRDLESKFRSKDEQVKRKQEEILSLRRQLKPISGEFGKKRKEAIARRNKQLTKKALRKKWHTIENKISEVITQREIVSQVERQMERLLQQREDLQASINKKQEKKKRWHAKNKRKSYINELDTELIQMQENVDFISSQIQDCQDEVMEVEKVLDVDSDMDAQLQNCSLEEMRYLINQFLALTMSKSTAAIQSQNKVIELQAALDSQVKSTKQTEELIRYIGQEHQDIDPALTDIITGAVGGSESDSSRDPSPERGETNSLKESSSNNKLRRSMHSTPQLLMGMSGAPASIQVDPGTPEKTSTLNSTYVVANADSELATQLYNSSDETNEPLNGTFVIETAKENGEETKNQSNLPLPVISDPEPQVKTTSNGFAEPTGVPLVARSNVFSRLTTYSINSPRNDKGKIVAHSTKLQSTRSSPLVCMQVAEGHNKAVLCIQATDHLLFSGSKDRCCKVWNLVTGQEIMSLDGHPNNVHALYHCPTNNLLYSVSLCYIKVWDIRSRAKCIRVVSSSGQSFSPSNFSGSMTRTNRMPENEKFISKVVVSKKDGTLFSASGKEVRVWDNNNNNVVAKLTGHTGDIMTLTLLEANKQTLITGSKDHYIKLYDISSDCSGNISPTLTLEPPHLDGVEALAVSEKHNVLFSGSRDKAYKKWCLNKKTLLKTEYQAHPGWVCALDILEQPGDDQLLVSGGRSGLLKLWDVESSGSIGEVRAHALAINDLTVNQQRIFTASSDFTVKIWKQR